MVSIHTNAGAISALQALRTINSGMASAQGQVSSGLRIQTAAENAAYWSISTTMRSDSKAVSAVQDALGLGAAKVETAYAGMEAVVGILSEFKSKLVAAKEPGVDKSKIQRNSGTEAASREHCRVIEFQRAELAEDRRLRYL